MKIRILSFIFVTFFLQIKFGIGQIISPNPDNTNTLQNNQTAKPNKKNIENEIKSLKDLSLVDSLNSEIYFKIGLLYFDEQKNLIEAQKYFEKSLQLQKDTNKLIFKYIGLCNLYRADYNKAISNFNIFNQLSNLNNIESKDIQVEKAISDCNYALLNLVNSDTIIVSNLGNKINSKYDDYSPLYNPDDSLLYFTSRRIGENFKPEDLNSEQYFESIYTSKLLKNKTEVNKLNLVGNNNSNDEMFSIYVDHHSIITASKKFDSLYIRADAEIQRLSLNEKGDIINSEYLELLKNSMVSSISISLNAKTIAIVTASKNSPTKKEIGIQLKNNQGGYGEPLILNNNFKISSVLDFPYLSKEGNTLIFSSNELPGYGGYDLYSSNFEDGVWSNPINLGLPINSSGNDISYFTDEKSKLSFAVSDRIGSVGLADIFQIKLKDKKIVPYDILDFEYKFDISQSIDTAGQRLVYKWNFSDGTSSIGESVMHMFNERKKFEISLTGIDTINQIIENNLAETVLDLSNETFLSIDVSNNLKPNTEVELNASRCFIKDSEISYVYWSIDGVTDYRNQKVLKKTFASIGVYTVKVFVKAKSNIDSSITYYTLEKKIIINDDEK